MATLAGTFTVAGFHMLNDLSQTAGADFKKVAVLYEDGACCTSGVAQAEKAAADMGVTITDKIAFHTNTADLSPIVNRAVASGAKALLLLCYSDDGINIIRAVRTAKAPVLSWAPAPGTSPCSRWVSRARAWLRCRSGTRTSRSPLWPSRRRLQGRLRRRPGIVAAWRWSDMY